MNALKLAFYLALLGATVYFAGEIISAIRKEVSEELEEVSA